MSKNILFTQTFWDTPGGTGVPMVKFQAGSIYPRDSETERHLVLGNAIETDEQVSVQADAVMTEAAAPAPAEPAPAPEEAPAPAEAPAVMAAPTEEPPAPAEAPAEAPAPTQSLPRTRRSA